MEIATHEDTTSTKFTDIENTSQFPVCSLIPGHRLAMAHNRLRTL